jgi:hypothetical protein
MTSETNTPLAGGTDNAQPSTDLDNPANWDYFDPDDEQDNEKPKAATGTAVEKAEDEAPEAPVQEAETDEQQEQTAEEPDEKPDEKKANPSIHDDVKITLKGGEEVTLRELRDGYMRQSHFTRERQKDAQRATHIQQVSDRIQSFLAAQIPPPPEPALAYQNPNAYAAQMAQHDAAKRHWLSVVDVANEAKATVDSFNAEQHQQVVESQMAMLTERLPSLASDEGRTKFREKISPVAELIGLSPDELSGIVDHRFLIGLDLAAEGLAARKSREVAKQKVQNVPPVAPAKRQAAQSPKAMKNAEAMKRLSRSGSIYDALNVDFD